MPILLFVALMEALLQPISNTYDYKSDYLATNSRNVEGLILGSSHAFYDVNPAHLSTRFFNAALPAQTPDVDSAILFKYIAQMKQLQTVIISISSFSLYQRLLEGQYNQQIKLYQPYNIGKHSPLDYLKITNRPASNFDILRRVYLQQESLVTCDTLGFVRKYKEGAKDFEVEGKKTAQRHNQMGHQMHLAINAPALKKIVEYCDKKGIQTILFIPPAHVVYRQSVNASRMDTTIETCQSIATQYNNCTFLNFFSDEDFEDLFEDADHLNAAGATILTQKLEVKRR